MDAYQMIEYKPTFPVDEISKALYEYDKRKKEMPRDSYQSLENKAYGLDSLLEADEKVIGEEIESIGFQIAERERIKQRNVRFLEDQRRKSSSMFEKRFLNNDRL